MKYILILACLVVYVVQSEAQSVSSCRGYVAAVNQTCVGGLNEGHNQWRHCSANSNRNMWYYDTASRRCWQMAYKGCGGNHNRYCTRDDCRWQCRRSI
ncbi:kappaPI-actitoxin-Avd3c-like [Drosophila innubila]|uniref:kappaPI-actitoxin-Avd3c-like n=1 Tax=Drosophila innubila TaxID=198719 RepID=UPI00148C4984|nr:kappaPI-actitoxin-Avd3c-like [Drosophila innubila]